MKKENIDEVFKRREELIEKQKKNTF